MTSEFAQEPGMHGYAPLAQGLLLAPLHPLCDGVLTRRKRLNPNLVQVHLYTCINWPDVTLCRLWLARITHAHDSEGAFLLFGSGFNMGTNMHMLQKEPVSSLSRAS